MNYQKAREAAIRAFMGEHRPSCREEARNLVCTQS